MVFDNSVKESPFLGFAGFGGGISWDAVQKYLDAVYVEDVFSTYLYEGTGSTQTITNGIDLAGEGGMVLQRRRSTGNWFLNDTENGANNFLYTNLTNELAVGTTESSFNSDGFTIGLENNLHNTGDDVASWTFRKAPGFFDVVTYTGDGTANRAIAHGLGSVPGAIIIKCTSDITNWPVYHRSIGTQNALQLNTTNATISSSLYFPTTPTSSQFFVSDDTANFNASGRTYVAYLFAHDDQSFGTNSDESIIKCGSYTGTGSSGNAINLGFEPQWVILKPTQSTTVNDWQIYDNMRGIYGFRSPTVNSAVLYPHLSNAESNDFQFSISSTGFTPIDSHNNNSGIEYIYIAIRRPHKPPEAGTDVFAVESLGATSPSPPGWTSGFPVDWALKKTKNTSSNWEAVTRLTGSLMYPNAQFTEALIQGTNDELDLQNGWFKLSTVNSENYSWMFRRAPGFFDVTTYTGTGGAHDTAPLTVNHNLGVAPELIIVKDRDRSKDWKVWTTSQGDTKLGTLNSNVGWAPDHQIKDVTSTTFKVGTDGAFTATNYSGDGFVAYLFATVPGVSKVGTYTGTGAALNVDCGFTNGARFVLTKRTDFTGDWTLFDTARGINTGTESRLSPNQDSPENISDSIDPYPQGFALTTDQGDTNVTGGTYIFLAIA